MTEATGHRAATPYRVFTVEVRRLRRLSPTFLRVTFTGADLDAFADTGFDQRIKLAFPLEDGGLAHFPTGPDWYSSWCALPDDRRNPLRTFTVRAARPLLREVDVDVVLHENGGGPGARWAFAAQPGDAVAIVGPDAAYPGAHGGLEFKLPARTGAVLLAGDETAVPAIGSILERLPQGTRGEALLEVPGTADTLDVEMPPGVRVDWLARDGAEHGSRLIPAVKAAAARLAPAGALGDGTLEDVDDDSDLWEVPIGTDGAPPATASEVYAWLAGEAGVIRTLRRHLVAERGMDRRSVAFMGYWRRGRAEDNG